MQALASTQFRAVVQSAPLRPAPRRAAVAVCAVKAEGKQSAQLSAAVRPALGLVLSNAVLAAPAFAEAGKIFDFNATLPLMAGQFLLLMIILDKLVYSPVGKVLDERDTDLRTKLEAVKDNAGDLMKFTTEADGIIRAARDEAAAEIAKAKDEAEKESSQKIGAAKAKLDTELKSAVSALEQQRAASMASIDTEVNKLSDSIVNKVLVSA